MRLPDEDHFCYAALLRNETTDPGVIAQMLSGNRALFEYNRGIGGTLYPFAALEMQSPDWRRHYGPQWRALVKAKHRHDPHQLLASGPNLQLEP